MIKKKINYSLLATLIKISGAILLVIVILIIIPYIEISNNTLCKYYYLGGILSGIFAFGAFIVAIVFNYIQNRTWKIQRFETTFFNMLKSQQELTNELFFCDTTGICKEEKKKIIRGRELFRYFFEEIEFQGDLNGMKGLIEKQGRCIYDSVSTTYFDHYFTHLYIIIKFVHNTKFLNDNDKYEYIRIVRATLSRYELIWLYYNCIYGVGALKFKPLVEKYSLLKNMRNDLLAFSKENKDNLEKKGIEYDKLKSSKFSGTDYEFYLTNKENDKGKYYIGAFYNYENLKKGEEIVKKWKKFIINNC